MTVKAHAHRRRRVCAAQIATRPVCNILTQVLNQSVVYLERRVESLAVCMPQLNNTCANFYAKDLTLNPGRQRLRCAWAITHVFVLIKGDERVNEVMGLTVIHIFFAREHNRIEAKLHRINPHWNGDKLYHETRRIMGGTWQYMVYNEFLPVVLGPELINRHSLRLNRYGYYDGIIILQNFLIFMTFSL